MKDNEQEVCQILNIVLFHTKNSLVGSYLKAVTHTNTHTAESHRILWCPWLHYYRLSVAEIHYVL